MRKKEISYSMKGHTDTITGLALSSDGSYLLSNSMDNTLRIWDVRPFAPVERCVKIFSGHQHNFEKNLLRCAWSPDGNKARPNCESVAQRLTLILLQVSGGSADRFVYIWDTSSRRIIYKLPGHTGCVNSVAFHPNEPIVVSVGSDKMVYIGEID